jgi:hypothetical protein
MTLRPTTEAEALQSLPCRDYYTCRKQRQLRKEKGKEKEKEKGHCCCNVAWLDIGELVHPSGEIVCIDMDIVTVRVDSIRRTAIPWNFTLTSGDTSRFIYI